MGYGVIYGFRGVYIEGCCVLGDVEWRIIGVEGVRGCILHRGLIIVVVRVRIEECGGSKRGKEVMRGGGRG